MAILLLPEGERVVRLPLLNLDKARELFARWFQSYYEARVSERYSTLWQQNLSPILQELAPLAVDPVISALAEANISRWIISANKVLHLFPLHACRLADGRFLADVVEVVYTASLSLLHRCARRLRSQPVNSLIAADPTGDLLFANVEGRMAQRRWPHATLKRGLEIDREWLVHDAPSCHVFHYAGHAFFNLDDPLASALILQDKDKPTKWLMLRDLFTGLHLDQCSLAIISGCESNQSFPDNSDELVGLTAGFLYAGATCVLSTLWAVNDLSSALLMDKFLSLWPSEMSIAAALREAQRWLREDISTGRVLCDEIMPKFLARVEVPEYRKKCAELAVQVASVNLTTAPFASPFHWAAMTVNGYGYK